MVVPAYSQYSSWVSSIISLNHSFVTFLFLLLLGSTCRYATPFGLTSEYAHPAEILFLGFATVVGPALTGPHLLTLWLWVVLRVLETVEAHSGYHFPWSPSNFLPLYGGLVMLCLKLAWAFFLCTYHALIMSWHLIVAFVVPTFMTTITVCFIPSPETTHLLLSTWTGECFSLVVSTVWLTREAVSVHGQKAFCCDEFIISSYKPLGCSLSTS